MTRSDWQMLCGFRADVENLNSHNEAELRRQFEERQQETEHVHELLENKIQLLQEVSQTFRDPWLRTPFHPFPDCSASRHSPFLSFLSFPDSSKCPQSWVPNLGGTSQPLQKSFHSFLQESRLAKNEATRMAALVEAEKECNLELSEKLKGVTKDRDEVPTDRVDPDQYTETLAQRDK